MKNPVTEMLEHGDTGDGSLDYTSCSSVKMNSPLILPGELESIEPEGRRVSNLALMDGMERLGTESAFVVLGRASELERQGKDVINLGIGQPDFRTPGHIVEAAVGALRDGHHGYTPANGILPLREAVAADISARREIDVNPDHVVIVPGGKVTMWHAILMFGAPGREIMYPNPGFPIYESAIRFTGATPVPIALAEADGFAFDPDEVLGQVTEKTRLIIVNSPANPTGGVIPVPVLDRLAEGLADHPHVAILSDEIYSRIVYPGSEFASMLRYSHLRDRLIMLDGWSKTYAMTGWRIGYAIWPESLVEHAVRLNINSVSCTNAATQYAAIAALEGPQDDVDAMVTAFAERREVLIEEVKTLPGLRMIRPEGAFYAMPNVEGTGIPALELQDRLLEELHIATVAGTSFGALGEGYIRLSYAAGVDEIRTAMKRIRQLAVAEGWGHH